MGIETCRQLKGCAGEAQTTAKAGPRQRRWAVKCTPLKSGAPYL